MIICALFPLREEDTRDVNGQDWRTSRHTQSRGD